MTSENGRKTMVDMLESVAEIGTNMAYDQRKALTKFAGEKPFGDEKLPMDERLALYRERREDPQFFEQMNAYIQSVKGYSQGLWDREFYDEIVKFEKLHREG